MYGVGGGSAGYGRRSGGLSRVALGGVEPEPEGIAYRELPPPRDLGEHVLCRWVLHPGARRRRHDVVLPDGCMDLIWRPGHGAVVAGPDTGPAPVTRRPGATVVGVRFHPGAGAAILGLPAEELRDLRVPLAELWGDGGRRLEEGLDARTAPEERLELMEAELRRRAAAAGRPDRLVARAVARLRRPDPPPIRRLAGELGISERQLRRRFRFAVGYGPKTLARVLRFQRMLSLARGGVGRGDLAPLALAAGFADQAHMTAECTRLAGLSPGRLLRAEG
jgi:AraC-like DNA-binding protein